MAAETKTNEKPQVATPAQIAKTTSEVAALLAGYTSHEQARIIRAAAAINGLEQGKR
jgi:hypothetical protein